MKNSSLLKPENLVLVGVISCFVLSGFAALLYQTAWMRQFSLVFGTSELAIAAVLSSYMGGLALGAGLAARYVGKVTRPVLVYGLLEAGIALSALSVPLLLKLASFLYISLLGGQTDPVDASGLGQSFFYLIIAFVVLLIPTSFMGATLPLLTKYIVRTNEQVGSRVGLLYATNTAGAIAGTLVAAFLLLPRFGLSGTVFFGVAVNFLVFILAAWLARTFSDRIQQDESSGHAYSELDSKMTPSNIGIRRLWILPIMLLSGANSFIYEVLWTRLLGHVLGGSIAAFATMLAGFLSGIAIGSAVASRFATDRESSTRRFILVQCGIAITSILIYQLLPLTIREGTGLNGNILMAISVLLPATIFIGATFPFAVRMLAVDQNDAASSSAKVYSWNTVGAIFGATLAAFFLIPMLKYEGAIKFAVLLNAMLALATVTLLGRQPRMLLAGVLAFVIGLGVFYKPSMPEDILRASPVVAQPGGEIRFYEVGRSATVLVIEENGFLNLRTNGLPEASTSLKGAPPSRHNQLLLSTLPVLARPDTESMLIIGLGAGVALEGVPPTVKEIDVIELEPQVVAANQSFADRRANNPLADSRFNITINDARSALTLTDKKYDAIVSQPSHPWTAGASHLYTLEFMQLAKDHLSEEGVFLQWMNTQFVDEALLKSLSATLLNVFPNVRLYQWDPEVLFFLGSDAPLNVELDMARTGRPISDAVLSYFEKGVGSVEDVVAALAMDQQNLEDFASGAALITDNNNLLATGAAQAMDQGRVLYRNQLFELLKPYDPLMQPSSPLRRLLGGQLNFPYISRRMENVLMTPRAIDLANSLIDAGNSQSLVMIGRGQARQGEREESQRNLLRALAADPLDQQARYALLQPWLSDILFGTEVPEIIAEELAKLAGTAAATMRGLIATHNDDMFELVQLDATLASVLPSDLWYSDSVKLRSEWRVRLTTPEYQPRMANEATALIDSAIAFTPDFGFYLLRLKSTDLAGDVQSTLETARRLLFLFTNEIERVESELSNFGPATKILRNQQFDEVGELLEKISSDGIALQLDIELIEATIAELRSRLDAL
jgi:spermidine synthase